MPKLEQHRRHFWIITTRLINQASLHQVPRSIANLPGVFLILCEGLRNAET